MVVLFKFIFLIVPLGYILFGKNISLVMAAVLFLYFLILKLSESGSELFKFFVKSKLYSGIRDIAKERQIGFLYMLGAIFIVTKFFQKDIACFSLVLSLLYIATVSLFEMSSKIRVLNRPLDMMVVVTLAMYFLAKYLGAYFMLNDNVVNYSVLALPLIHFSLRWPEENFSVVFFTAFIAQFVKNSF